MDNSLESDSTPIRRQARSYMIGLSRFERTPSPSSKSGTHGFDSDRSAENEFFVTDGPLDFSSTWRPAHMPNQRLILRENIVFSKSGSISVENSRTPSKRLLGLHREVDSGLEKMESSRTQRLSTVAAAAATATLAGDAAENDAQTGAEISKVVWDLCSGDSTSISSFLDTSTPEYTQSAPLQEETIGEPTDEKERAHSESSRATSRRRRNFGYRKHRKSISETKFVVSVEDPGVNAFERRTSAVSLPRQIPERQISRTSLAESTSTIATTSSSKSIRESFEISKGRSGSDATTIRAERMHSTAYLQRQQIIRGDRKSTRFSAPDLHRPVEHDTVRPRGTGDKTRLNQIMQEIVDSEVAYFRMLSDVKEVFIDPLVRRIDRGKPILGKNELNAVFFQWDVLLEMHKEVMDRLQEEISDPDPSSVAEIFLEYSWIFGTYSAYYANYSRASRILDQAKNNPRFVRLCKRRRVSDKLGMGELVDQLIKPVQRIPRYTLLLKELRKHVSEPVDGVSVDAAIYALDDISRKSEVVIADAEGVTKLLDLQAKLKDANVINVPHRRLLQQAAVSVSLMGSPFTNSKDRLLIVCSDKLFLLKGTDDGGSGMLRLRKVIDIDKAFIFGVSKTGSFCMSCLGNRMIFKCKDDVECLRIVDCINRAQQVARKIPKPGAADLV